MAATETQRQPVRQGGQESIREPDPNAVIQSWDTALGDGMTADRNQPYRLTSLSGVVAVAAGAYHSVALMQDGALRSWGSSLCQNCARIQRLHVIRVSF